MIKSQKKTSISPVGPAQRATRQPSVQEEKQTVGCSTTGSSPDQKQRFPSVSDIFKMLPEHVNLEFDREKLLCACMKALHACLPSDNPLFEDPRLMKWLDEDHSANDKYDKSYRWQVAKHLLGAYVEPVFAALRTTKYWEALKKTFESGKRMDHFEPRIVRTRWLTEFCTLLPNERHKFRGQPDRIRQYHEDFNRFHPIVVEVLNGPSTTRSKAEEDLIDMGCADLLTDAAGSGRLEEPAIPENEVNKSVYMAISENDDGLQKLHDEVQNFDVVAVTDEAALIRADLGDGKGDVEIIIPHTTPAPEPEPSVPGPELSFSSESAFGDLENLKFTIEGDGLIAPENIVTYKYIPFWLIVLSAVLVFGTLIFFRVGLSWVPFEAIYSFEVRHTSSDTVLDRIWSKNWFFVNYPFAAIEAVTNYYVNPVIDLVQTPVNFVSWATRHLHMEDGSMWAPIDLRFTRLEIMQSIYGENEVWHEHTYYSGKFHVLLLKFQALVERYIAVVAGLWIAFIFLFGNRMLSLYDCITLMRLRARRIKPTYLLASPYLTYDVAVISEETVYPTKDLRPKPQMIGTTEQVEYVVATVEITVSNQVCNRFDIRFAKVTGFLMTALFGTVRRKHKYRMDILPAFLADVMDIKALNSLKMSEFQSRVRQIMASAVHFNFDKYALSTKLENYALNTLIYAAMLKKYDENKRQGNFPAGLWTELPAASTS